MRITFPKSNLRRVWRITVLTLGVLAASTTLAGCVAAAPSWGLLITLAFTLSSLFGLTACGDQSGSIDNGQLGGERNEELVINPIPDYDGDGWAIWDDCNDENATIHPGAEELCWDSIDNNCDGQVDLDGACSSSWRQPCRTKSACICNA